MVKHIKSSMVNEVFDSGIMNLYNGEYLTLGDVPFMLIPISNIFLLNEIKTKYPKITMNELYYQLGKMQSHRGNEILVKRYGFKPDQKLMQDAFGKSELLGMGVFEFIDFDEKNKSFTVINTTNPYAHQYLRTLGKQKHAVCHYLRGLCAGNFQAFWEKEDMLAIEVACIAKGDPACIFKIKPKKKWNQKKSIIKEQIVKNKIPRKIFDEFYNWDKLVSRHAGKPKSKKQVEEDGKRLKEIIKNFKNKSL